MAFSLKQFPRKNLLSKLFLTFRHKKFDALTQDRTPSPQPSMEETHGENPPGIDQQTASTSQSNTAAGDRQLQALTHAVTILSQTMNNFLANHLSLLQQQRLSMSLALPHKGPIPPLPPSAERNKLPSEEVNTLAAGRVALRSAPHLLW
ncbi:hypothetical protein AXF42_Ash021502 [Apostasia shenzhenica]|uniref:Uncharacterized protein n=1 Tax=Apostasia shenzhenica TaxID=1088818 RepID=A0A2I0A0A1_9ASPA|nr:hypothetical protein AXF42_Ash021502 [Apostasia shenzhenica]